MGRTRAQEAEYRRTHRDAIRRDGRASYHRNKHRWSLRLTKLAFLRWLKDQPCEDCGNTFPAPAMDFDHRGEKRFNVMQAVSRSWDALYLEVMKCNVVCANCHRVRTWKARNGA